MKSLIFIILLNLVCILPANAQLTVTTPFPGLTVSQCMQSDSHTDIVDSGCAGRTHVLSVGGSLTLTNSDCGAYISPSAFLAPISLTLPGSPLNNCTFTVDTSMAGNRRNRRCQSGYRRTWISPCGLGIENGAFRG